jgi:hypothetical protein
LAVFFSEKAITVGEPEQGSEYIQVYKQPITRKVIAWPASSEDLLLLKMLVENITPEEIARLGSLPVENVYAALDRAADARYACLPPH